MIFLFSKRPVITSNVNIAEVQFSDYIDIFWVHILIWYYNTGPKIIDYMLSDISNTGKTFKKLLQDITLFS